MKRATGLFGNNSGSVYHFNPRPREEGDEKTKRKNAKRAYISIHALVKRATLSVRPLQFSQEYFNPRPREEGDKSWNNYTFRLYDFNPRPREEGDNVMAGMSEYATVFQSTPS